VIFLPSTFPTPVLLVFETLENIYFPSIKRSIDRFLGDIPRKSFTHKVYGLKEAAIYVKFI